MKRSERIADPVFLIGMPRSGTSIIYEALIQHEALGWPPHYLKLLPACPELCVINRFFQTAGAKQQRGRVSFLKKLVPRPDEMYPMWKHLVGDEFLFSFLRDAEPSENEINRVRNYFERLVRAEGKQRLAVKLTGPPRMRYLSRVFPDAIFIEILRDPRAVVASLLQVSFWRDSGPDTPFWIDALSDEQIAACNAEPSHAAALAARQYMAVHQQTSEERSQIANRFQSILYEQFVAEPLGAINRLLRFCDLAPSTRLETYVLDRGYRNMNSRYRQILTASDIQTVERICAPLMATQNYDRQPV